MSEKWPTAKKDLCLKRLKAMAVGGSTKVGKLEKNLKGKYVFVANELLKPKNKGIRKESQKEITPQ